MSACYILLAGMLELRRAATCVTFLHLNLNKDSVLLHYIGHTLVLVMQSLT
jgi:hypothetical protein